MKKYIKIISVILVFALFVLGSSLLYNKLAANYASNQKLKIYNNTEKDTAEKSTTESDTAEVVETETQTASQTEQASDFTVVDADNNEVALSSLFGKPIVLNFWASWCPPCKSEMPEFQTAYETYGFDVQFVMVNLTDGERDTVESAGSFVKEQGYTFPVYFDVNQEAAYAYYVTSIPATYFIDKDGNIAASTQGMLNSDTLEQGIALITNK